MSHTLHWQEVARQATQSLINSRQQYLNNNYVDQHKTKLVKINNTVTKTDAVSSYSL